MSILKKRWKDHHKLYIILLLVCTVFTVQFLTVACTENERAKNYGGKATINVPCGQKVGNITWKATSLWYSTTPMEEGYEPKTHIFKEDSSYGIMQGTYILVESKCN